jgi:hypothetical protein
MKSKRMVDTYGHRYKEKNMAKKCLLVLVLAGFVAGGIFAQDEEADAPKSAPKGASKSFAKSAGVGGYFSSDFGGGFEIPVNGNDWSMKTPYVGGGFFGFFNWSYFEVSLGFFFGGGTTKVEFKESHDYDVSLSGMDISLFGKYPFDINEKLTVFPLAGATWRIVSDVSMDGKDYSSPEDFTAIWIRLGGGADYSFTDKIYLRAGLTYGFRFANSNETDPVSIQGRSKDDLKPFLGHGLEIKVAAGYRF